MFLADKVGRKVSLVMYFIFTSVILTVAVIPFFRNFMKITVRLERFMASQSLRLVFVFISESFLVKDFSVKDYSVGTPQTLGKVLVITTPFPTQRLMHISKLSIAFITNLLCVIGIIAILLMPKDTRRNLSKNKISHNI